MILGGLALLLAFLAGDYVFNLRSNAHFLVFRDSTAPLEVRLANGEWKLLSSTTIAELDLALDKQAQEPGATWKTCSVRRQAKNWKQQVVQQLFTAEITVIEFDGQAHQFAVSYQDKFALTTARERQDAEKACFTITANFRDPSGKPLGLVVHEGKEVNRPFQAWTGYFFVKDGKPWFGPKSLFEETPGTLQEATQGYPSLMKNHTVFSYVDLAPNRYFDGDKITYRSLAGVKQNGSVIFVLSGNGGVMNVAEVTALAQKLNVQHATLLDGGKALQYSLTMGGVSYHFHAFNTLLDFQHDAFAWEKSPVFIAARRR